MSAKSELACSVCGGKAENLHHPIYRSNGGDDNQELVPLCRHCHVELHRADWPEWGKKAHTVKPEIVLNLRQYRDPSRYNRKAAQLKRDALNR